MPRFLLLMSALLASAPALAQRLEIPETRRDTTVVDDYHGTLVPDPYRWLEDAGSDETAAWIEAQNAVTEAFLGAIPARETLRERLTELWDYPKYGLPFREGGRTFFFKNDGLQNQSVLYQQATPEAEPEVLLDPNALSEDGTVALTTLAVSRDGRRLVYGTSQSGSDWQAFRVRDVETGEDLAEELRWIKFSSAAWAPDGSGFYYSRYEEPAEGEAMAAQNLNQKLYFHRLGTEQDEDALVYARPDVPEMGFGATVTRDGRYLVISATRGTDPRNDVFVQDLEAGGDIRPLFDAFDAAYWFVGNTGSTLYFLTDREAPNRRLVAVELERPEPEHWRELVPESEAVLQSATIVHERLVVSALSDVASRLTIHTLEGDLEREVELPALGSIAGISGRREDDAFFYAFTSFAYPTTIYRYDVEAGQSTVFRAPEIDFDPEDYAVEQVFYPSKDGTRIPMFIVHKKGLARDGQNPTYLYGYGGFDVSLTPAFSVSNLAWLELGGIYAVANLRGGGEYGQAWHEAGMLDKKQNVFDDFIAAAEYLIAEGYTSAPKLAIGGGSNGGLLVGAAITQRPELFGAALPAVGVMDMLRFHRFTIGWAWVSEYGSADDPEQFRTLYAYSPLHNLRPGTAYPATLVTTADHDDRVVPGHSFKFAAALQAAQGGEAPTLIRVETKAGHGAGKPTAKLIEEAADRWAFLVDVLNVDVLNVE